MKVSDELSKTLVLLAAKRPLSASEAEATVILLNRILRSGQSEAEWSPQSEMAWDDAWDSLDYFDVVHRAAIPYLSAVITNVGNDTAYDRYARKWAIKAAGKIGATNSEYISSLNCALKSSDISLGRQANSALRKIKNRGGMAAS